MSPLHDELRRAMRQQTTGLPAAPDPLAGIERRARSIHRRRVAGAVAGSALAVCAVGVGVPVAVHVGSQAHHHPLAKSGSPTAAAPSGKATATSARPTPISRPKPPPPLLWGFTGDPRVRAALAPRATAAMDAWFADEQATHAAHGQPAIAPDGEPAVVFACTDRFGRQVALLLTAVSGDGPGAYVAAAYVAPPGIFGGTLTAVHDVAADAAQVSAVLPPPASDTPSYVVVVAAPGSQSLEYAADGRTFASVDGLGGTVHGRDWWLVRRLLAAGARSVPQIRLTGPGGTVRYQGPIGQGVTFPDV